MNQRILTTAMSSLLLLGGCTVGPDFTNPNWASPTSWFTERTKPAPAPSRVVAEPIDPAWWNLFNDKTLSALEARVAAQNLDVQVAEIRLAESRAERGVVGAAQFPTVNGNASYVRQQASNRGVFTKLGKNAVGATDANGTVGGAGAITGVRIEPFEAYQYGFDASWELDLWGRVARSVESADSSMDASAEEQRAVLLTNLAEVARDYMELRGAQARLQIARDNLKIAQDNQHLVRQRAEGGMTTDLDVANASAQVATTAAEIPALEQQEAQLINALSLLLGQPPQALAAELHQARPVPPVPPTVPVGLPSELARRRPDIREAEAQLHAATADIGVAVASFYPSFSLSGSMGIQALRPTNLFNWNALQYAFGPTLNIPIFEGGRLKATLELRKAQQREAAVKYQQVVLKAWHEVDNALTAYETEQRRREQLTEAVRENARALSLAQSRYREGVANFLDVLVAQRSLLATQELLALSTTQVSDNLVAIYKALGGGWETDLPLAAGQEDTAGAAKGS
jgi:NodT family efflux transporter outer membrane factor (OMF) lipoprotein